MQVSNESKSMLTYNNDIKKFDKNVTKQFKYYKTKKFIIRRK